MVPRVFVYPRFHGNGPRLLPEANADQLFSGSAVKDTPLPQFCLPAVFLCAQVNLLTYSRAIRTVLHLTSKDRKQAELWWSERC